MSEAISILSKIRSRINEKTDIFVKVLWDRLSSSFIAFRLFPSCLFGLHIVRFLLLKCTLVQLFELCTIKGTDHFTIISLESICIRLITSTYSGGSPCNSCYSTKSRILNIYVSHVIMLSYPI